MEKDLRHELSQKDVEFERLMSKLKEEVANKETRLSTASGKMEEVKIKKEEIVQMIKKMLQKFDQFKKKIDDDNENEDNSFWILEDNRTQRTNGEFDDLSEVLGKLKRVFRWIEKYLMKIDSFTTSKAKFIQVKKYNYKTL